MDQNQTKEPRPPVNLRIKFRSENVEQFIERYAVDVSRGGIFIRTRDPLAVGTQLRLDFQFQNGTALMAGEGTVVWIREVDPNRTSVPPGMGVRFDKLSPESQAVLEQLLIGKAKRERGGTPGSAGQGAGGIAVRRPSSMFSVLEPQVSVADGASGDATTTATATTASAPPASTEVKRGAAAGTAAGNTDAPSPAYRPLGTARNPFASPTQGATPRPVQPGPGGAAKSVTPAPTSTASSGPRPLADLLPLLAKTVAPVAPAASAANDDDFDDLNEEPTQIAGRLPSFLTSDSEATTEVPADLAASVKTAAPLPFDYLPGASPDTARPATRAKPSLDEAPPEGAAAQTAADLVAAKTDTPGADAPMSETAAAAETATETAAASTSSEAIAAAAPGAETPASADSAKDHAAKTPPAKKRSATPVVAAVLVLGVSAIFLYKFFGSQSSENVTSAPASGALPTIRGEPAAPAPAAAAAPEPPPAPVPAAPAVPAPPPAPTAVEPARSGEASTGENKPAVVAGESAPEAGKKSTTKRKLRTGGGASTAEPAAAAAAPPAPADTAGTAGDSPEALAVVHQIRVTSKPAGADVLLDGQSIGKTPLSTGIADVSAPHSIAIRKDGFEPFEQMIGASSAWSKSKAAKGKAPLQILKLNARLKQIGGGSAEGKPSTEPPAAEVSGESAAKTEPKLDRPLPPSDVPAGDSPPP